MIRRGLFGHTDEIWQQKAVSRYQRLVIPWHVQGTPTQVNYVVASQLGGLTNILRVWSGRGSSEPPEQAKGVTSLATRQLANNLNAN